MKRIYNSNLFSVLKRISPTEMLAQCVLISTNHEAVARIRATTGGLLIQEADWEIYRSPLGQKCGGAPVPELNGVRAYLDAGPSLRAVGDKYGQLPRELLAECVKGIIQAEAYLYKEMGFASTDDFEEMVLEKSYDNSCRLSSNKDRQIKTWYEHIASRKWGDDTLFTRCKAAMVNSAEDGVLYACGEFTDSFHELGINLKVSGGVVTSSSGNFLRSPDPVCEETMVLLEGLKGQAVESLTKRQVGGYVGGPQGCDHIVDLADYVLRVLRDLG